MVRAEGGDDRRREVDAATEGVLRARLACPRASTALGLKPAEIRTARDVAQLATDRRRRRDRGRLGERHPNIATINSTNTTTTKALLGQTPAVASLARYIEQMQQQGKAFASVGVAKDPDGSPTKISVPIKLPNRGAIGDNTPRSTPTS